MKKIYRESFLSFVFASAIFFAVHQLHNIVAFSWDAGGYWSLSEPSVFFNYPKNIRGYFFPLLIMPANILFKMFPGYEFYPYRIYSSIAYGFLLTNVVPPLYVKLFGGTLSVTRRLILPTLIAVLFPGLIIYPLSDLPAFILFVSAVTFLFKIKNASTLRNVSAFAFFAGAAAAAAYNTRTIYLFPLIFVIFSAPLYFLSGRSLKERSAGLLAFVLGLILISVPQSIINHKHQDTWSPAVIAQRTEKSLFALQLMWGVTMQRYETTIDQNAPAASRYFLDRVGEQVFEKESLVEDDVTIGRYLTLVARYPMEFGGIYARHFINGLDLRDGQVYVKDIHASSAKIAVFNFLVIALALLVAIVRYANRRMQENEAAGREEKLRTVAPATWPAWLLVWLIPVFAILPGAIETRFFLPLHVLLYCTIAFNTSIKEVFAFIKMHRLPVFCSLIGLAGMYLAVSTNTMSSLAYFIPDAYRFGQ